MNTRRSARLKLSLAFGLASITSPRELLSFPRHIRSASGSAVSLVTACVVRCWPPSDVDSSVSIVRSRPSSATPAARRLRKAWTEMAVRLESIPSVRSRKRALRTTGHSWAMSTAAHLLHFSIICSIAVSAKLQFDEPGVAQY